MNLVTQNIYEKFKIYNSRSYPHLIRALYSYISSMRIKFIISCNGEWLRK